MAARAAIRASDADREHVAERLREAAGEGRLRTEELEHRLETALGARTYGELDGLLRDLPGRRLAAPSQPRAARGLAHGALALTLALAAALAVAIVVLFVLTGVFAGWLLWILAGWLFLGRRRRTLHTRRGRCARSVGGCGHWSVGRPPRHWA